MDCVGLVVTLARTRRPGALDDYAAGKYLRDTRVTTLQEGTSQIQKLPIGRALTGSAYRADRQG